MPDERTYGFAKDDAESLVQSIGNGENWFPEIKPRGRGGTSAHTMWFSIVDVHCPDDYDPQWYIRVTPLYYTGNCGSVPPGRQEDGYWHFYSLCGFDSDQVDSELPGTVGWGTYFYPYTADDYDPPACVPVWLILDLCGMPEC